VATGLILLLLVLGLALLPPRKGDWEPPSEIRNPYRSLYGERSLRPPVQPGRLSDEGHGSRSTERTRQPGEDREIGMERDPLDPSDAEGR
jgi:hypothetical protein